MLLAPVARECLAYLFGAGLDSTTAVTRERLRIALARQFPALRRLLFDQVIDETSRANASYAFSTGLAEIVPILDIPLNIGFTGKGNTSMPEGLLDQIRAGAIGLKLHEDWGTTPAAIDNALYNAFGQRLISTIFTQASQYRVVLEVKPEFQRGLGALDNIYVASAGGGVPGFDRAFAAIGIVALALALMALGLKGRKEELAAAAPR